MKERELIIKLFLSLFFLTFFNQQIEGSIIEIIQNMKYPIVFNGNDENYNIITSGTLLTLEKKTNKVINQKSIISYDPPFFIFIDDSNKYFMFTNNIYYSINFDKNKLIEISTTKKKISTSKQYIDYIKEKKYTNVYLLDKIRCTTADDEIAFYGNSKNIINFYYYKESKEYQYSFKKDKIIQTISCKLIESAKYICAYIINSQIYLGTFLHVCDYKVLTVKKKQQIVQNRETSLNEFINYDDVILYDTSDKNNKIFCALNSDSETIKCKMISVDIEFDLRETYKTDLKTKDLEKYYDSLSFNIKNCYFLSFYSKYLLCCANINIITCSNFDKNFNKINEFSLDSPGNNLNLTIINNNYYATLIFINENEIKSICGYNIYSLRCNNLTKEVIVYHSLDINMSELFTKEEGTKYYIKFENLPDKYSILKIDNNIIDIDSGTSPEITNPSKNIFHFIYNNSIYNTLQMNYIFYYYISTNEAFSNHCEIKITIFPCYNSCKYCSLSLSSSTSEKHNCINCREDYYPFSGIKSNCYTEDDVIENNYKWYFNEEKKIFELCNETCTSSNCTKCSFCYATCSSCEQSGNSNYHDCKSCKSGYYFIYNTTNCITEKYAKKNGYYKKSNYFFECDMRCSSCDWEYETNNTYCLECNAQKGFYPLYNQDNAIINCFNNESIEEGYYLDLDESTSYKWAKCYKKCQSCISGGNSNNMNCLSCKNNLVNGQTNKTFYFTLTNGNCIQTCSNDFYLTPEGDCVSNCPNGTYLYSLNSSCLKSCPDKYEKKDELNKCLLKSFDENTNLNDFKFQIMNNITEYVNSTSIINGSDFLAMILSSDSMEPKVQIQLGISAVDLGNCTQFLKEYYNISNDENLIILNMESKNKTKKNNTNDDKSFYLEKYIQLEVYDFSGRKLDLSVCKENIKIMKYIGDVEELNIQSAKTLSEQGIDIFNASDGFFNDLCHPYDSKDGIDIIINDRRIDIYQNVTFCEDGCSYSGMDYELMTANCLCDSSYIQSYIVNITNDEDDNNNKNEIINFKTMTKSFVSNLLDFNIDVIFCYNLVFNLPILKKNIGFYCMLGMLVLQIIFLCIFLIKKLKPIKYFMIIFRDNKKNKALNENKNKANPLKRIKKKLIIKSSLKNKHKDNNIINNNDTMLSNDKKNNESKIDNSKKKIKFNDNIGNLIEQLDINLENSIQKKSKKKFKNNPNKLLNTKNFDLISNSSLMSKKSHKNKKTKNNQILLNNNFSPTNDASPIFNSSKKQVSVKARINNLISDDHQEKMSQKGILNNIPLNIQTSKSNNSSLFKNNEKIHKEKSAQNIRKNNIFIKRTKAGNKYITNMETIGEIGIPLNKYEDKTMKLKETDEDLQELDYEEAIIHDKRSYLRMYWAFLVDTQIILGTFFTENYLNLFIIKLSFFICTFEISFFLNALFYTDEYISDAYHNEGVLDFISGLPKSIYSFVATLITTNLLKMLSNSKSELMKVIRENHKDINYTEIINLKLRKLRNKLIAYFIILFTLAILFWYYVSAFCAVYRYSQKYWFIGCLESFGMDSLTALIICLLLSLFRYVSIKKQKKYFYTLANIISKFL